MAINHLSRSAHTPLAAAEPTLDSWTPGDQTALLGVVLAAALAVFVIPGSWGWLNLALGVTLLLVLHAYDRDPSKRWSHLLAFGVVAGMCWVVATGVFAERILEFAGRPLPMPDYAWVEVEGQKHYSVSTDPASRLVEHETAIMWLVFGLLETVYAGVKRDKWSFNTSRKHRVEIASPSPSASLIADNAAAPPSPDAIPPGAANEA
jgi:hypothetical protein